MGQKLKVEDFEATGVVTIPNNALAIADTSGLQTALDAKAPLASPAFTGTPTGITATHVGLGNVTNESKATMFTNPVFTGTVTIPDNALAIADTSGLQTALDGKQPLDTQLTDLAGLSYAGNALKVVRVNAGETAFELAAASGGPATQLDSDGTTLDVNAIADGQFLKRVGSTIVGAAGGGGILGAGTVQIDMGSTPVAEGTFAFDPGTGVTAASVLTVYQAPGPYTGKGAGEDEAEMDQIDILWVRLATDLVTVRWRVRQFLAMVPNVNPSPKLTPAGATFDRLDNQRWPQTFRPVMAGWVSGYIAFNYIHHA